MEELHIKEIVNTRQCQREGVKVASTYIHASYRVTHLGLIVYNNVQGKLESVSCWPLTSVVHVTMRYTFLLYLYLTTNSIYNSYPIGRFTLVHIPYSGKLLREKTFANFAVLCFLCKIWGCGTSGAAKSCFSPFRESFLLWKFPIVP